MMSSELSILLLLRETAFCASNDPSHFVLFTLAAWNHALLKMCNLGCLTSVDFTTREFHASSRPVLCCSGVSWKRLQTGATDCASVRPNSWGRSSVLTGDDITWQVFIWLIAHSLALSQVPDTCFTSKALVQEWRAGHDECWSWSCWR